MSLPWPLCKCSPGLLHGQISPGEVDRTQSPSRLPSTVEHPSLTAAETGPACTLLQKAAGTEQLVLPWLSSIWLTHLTPSCPSHLSPSCPSRQLCLPEGSMRSASHVIHNSLTLRATGRGERQAEEEDAKKHNSQPQ